MLAREKFDRTLFKDIVDSIFAAGTREEALDIIESHNSFWLQIIGTRGATGKKTVNSATQFNKLFEYVDATQIDDEELDDENLETLEESLE
jgi:hypothetical protein